MWRYSFFYILSLPVLICFCGGIALGDFNADRDASLVALWRLNDGSGTTAVDDSPNGNHGTLEGDPQWVVGVLDGALAFDGSDDYVDCGNDAVFDITEQITLAIWVYANDMGNGQHNPWLGKGDNTYAIKHQSGNNVEFFIYDSTWNSINYTTGLDGLNGEWHHMAGTFDGDEMVLYIDGAVADTLALSSTIGTATHNVTLGNNSQEAGRFFDGMLDDARIYNRALTQEEIQIVMLGGVVPELASEPVPENEAVDVPRDDDLSWTAGEFAVTHDVYFGTSFDDVNTASRAEPLGVLISEGQTGTTYDPGRLEFGQTYYWRIDEVNDAPDNTVFKGETWSFTVEPFAYPVDDVSVTTNTTLGQGSTLESMIDGSGLNSDDRHSTDSPDMWLGVAGAEPAYVQFEFDHIYKLHEMRVWNYNVIFETLLGFGLRDVTVEYSVDGAEWTLLGNVEFAQATAQADYEANTILDFDGAAVKLVRLTINSGWGTSGQYGLSEVRFLYIPAHARAPQPADEATGVAVDTALSWRAGREAASHDVYLGTDPDALTPAGSVDTSTFVPDNLTFASTYYWRVDEVNEFEAVASWEGALWSFTVAEYGVIDDFESYDNEDNAIYNTWTDGWVNGTGSTAGYLTEPFAETSIVNSGAKSMPLIYDNSVAPFYSEVERDLGGLDLDSNGADTLRLYVYGSADAGADTLYVALEDSAGKLVVVTNPNAAAAGTSSWQEWLIPYSDLAGINLNNVSTIYIGVGDRDNPTAGGTGTVFVDDIGYGKPASAQ